VTSEWIAELRAQRLSCFCDPAVNVLKRLESRADTWPPDGAVNGLTRAALAVKLEATDFSAGAPMPLNYERLSDADVDILRKWIAQGALDD
jgi:hypothetical protein